MIAARGVTPPALSLPARSVAELVSRCCAPRMRAGIRLSPPLVLAALVLGAGRMHCPSRPPTFLASTDCARGAVLRRSAPTRRARRPGSASAFGLGWFGRRRLWVYVSMHPYGQMPAVLAALARSCCSAPTSALSGARHWASRSGCGAARSPAHGACCWRCRQAGAASEWMRGCAVHRLSVARFRLRARTTARWPGTRRWSASTASACDGRAVAGSCWRCSSTGAGRSRVLGGTVVVVAALLLGGQALEEQGRMVRTASASR